MLIGGPRRRVVARIAAVLLAMMTISITVTGAASAGLLSSTTNLVDTTLDTTLNTVDNVGGVLLGDGWLVEEGVETSMVHVNDVIGAKAVWNKGYTGKGIDIAVLDTGVVPVDGLTSSPVSNGPDLSFESLNSSTRYLDTYGHGTHMAGIAAGRSATAGGFRGVAPDAGLVSLKLGTYDGAVDVSQVVAAIDWVVQHRRSDGLNIRVLNLSYGTSSTQSYRVDPLAHAVENAWRNGIVVVTSVGNDGTAAPLSNPARDPYVLAVGAGDTKGTVGTSDDAVAAFSNGGTTERRPDLVAPGRSIVSLRDPGSYIDQTYPEARVGEKLFKGSGSSQAAAVVSGAAALLLQQRPSLTPDQVKALLKSTAVRIAGGNPAAGAGMVKVDKALAAATPTSVQSWARSAGTGSIEAARGGAHVADGDDELDGENSILGPWDASKWPAASAAGKAWSNGVWQGKQWSAACWCGTSWARRTWGASPWTGTMWSGADWSSRSWKEQTWDSRSWKGEGWTSRSWKDGSWDGAGWLGAGRL
jgi:serine protease AprX